MGVEATPFSPVAQASLLDERGGWQRVVVHEGRSLGSSGGVEVDGGGAVGHGSREGRWA